MILMGEDINVYDSSIAKKNSFFTGGMDLQTLDFDPLVTGYAFIIWTKVPFWVEKEFPGFRALTQKNFKSFDGIDNMELQTQTYTHSFNGNEYNFASSITKNNADFTLRHQEFSGSPIKNMYQHWVTGIRDPRTDIATYPARYGCEYAAKNHTGELLYIVTRPDVNNLEGKVVEFAAYYTNVLPLTLPLSHLAYSQGDHNGVELDIQFRGTMNISPRVDEFAKAQLKNVYAFFTEDLFDPENTPDYLISGFSSASDSYSTVETSNGNKGEYKDDTGKAQQDHGYYPKGAGYGYSNVT